jgi:hypothetical protein
VALAAVSGAVETHIAGRRGLVCPEGVRVLLLLALPCLVPVSAWPQNPDALPRFEEFLVKEVFVGEPLPPNLKTPDERKFQKVILQGVDKGWGVYDGTTGKEMPGRGANFAGHYILVSFGCGDVTLTDCLMAAIVDAKTGRVYPPPSPDSGMSYFGVFAETTTHRPPFSFHNTHTQLPLEYRLNSRLLVAKICEDSDVQGGSVLLFGAKGCGPHYYLMGEDGLSLIHRAVR